MVIAETQSTKNEFFHSSIETDLVKENLPLTGEVTLTKDELYAVIDIIELEFIGSIRKDPDMDNIDYIVSMMNALQKFRTAYNRLNQRTE